VSKDETIYIRVGSELREKLDREARLRGEALSVIVRDAIREYFADKDLAGEIARVQNPMLNDKISSKKQAEDEIVSAISRPAKLKPSFSKPK
jgi:predicted DNA-binding protein